MGVAVQIEQRAEALYERDDTSLWVCDPSLSMGLLAFGTAASHSNA